MKVTVLGATGGTGQHVVRQLLDASHDVTAYFRPSERLPEDLQAVRQVRAQPGDQAAIRTAALGTDAIICAVGCEHKAPSPITFALRAVLDVMAETGVCRLVALSTAAAAPPHQKSRLERFPTHPIRQWRSRDLLADMRSMEAMLVQSDTDWTVIRSPWKLTDGPATGAYHIAIDTRPRRTRSISRADLAAALIWAAFDPALTGRIVTVSY